MLTASLIFLITLILVIWQPRGLQIGTTAVIGAVAALILGVVSFNDVLIVFNIIWDATLAFIGIIILSMVLDEIGFFEWAALKMAKLSHGSGRRMFFYSIILGAVVSALFANDGAALILTPILLAKMRILRLNTKTILAFLLAGGFISDSASLPFVFSNLTNIVTADYFGIGFITFTLNMLLPYFVSVATSMLFLFILLHKDIPKNVNISLLPEPKSVLKNYALFKFAWFFLAFLLAAYAIGDIYHIPISIFALSGALTFLAIASYTKTVHAPTIIKEAPWQIVWFSLGLYVVVYGLKNAGLTHEITHILEYLNAQSQLVAVVATGFLAAGLSAVMNNMPTIMIMDIALHDIGNEAMIYANIVGCNLGPKMTPFGSLATLLWLHTLAKKDVTISFWSYSKFGLLITPPVLLLVLLSLV
ncbi:arsenic transporter [Sulfurimonas sp.]